MIAEREADRGELVEQPDTSTGSEPVYVSVTAIEAEVVGTMLRMLARTGMEPETALLADSVGRKLVTAARAVTS